MLKGNSRASANSGRDVSYHKKGKTKRQSYKNAFSNSRRTSLSQNRCASTNFFNDNERIHFTRGASFTIKIGADYQWAGRTRNNKTNYSLTPWLITIRFRALQMKGSLRINKIFQNSHSCVLSKHLESMRHSQTGLFPAFEK